MLLAIDIGNTNISIGLYKDNQLMQNWRMATDIFKTADEYALSFSSFLQRDGYSIEQIKQVFFISVVPSLEQVFQHLFSKIFSIPVELLEESQIPIQDNLYNRQELGIDRLLTAFAGFQKYKKPLIIIDFGTAITLDVVGKEGSYLGGMIMPGIRLASNALSSNTAKLPKVDFQEPKKIIGKNTIESMHSGMFFGCIGMVDFCIEKIFEEQGVSLVIATGGDAELIKKHSKKINKIENELTLFGIQFIYQIKHKKENVS